MAIHQLVHTLNYGDAISGEAITLKRLFAEQGLGGEIISVHAHEKVQDLQTPLSQIGVGNQERFAQSAVVLHYSIASPLNELFLSLSKSFRLVIYHNLTPEHWYHGYNARVVEDLRQAKRDLQRVIDAADLVIADSDFNRAELAEFGCKSATVLPLLIDSQKWSVASNSGIAGILRGHGGKNFLHVGRTAPNKCLEDIIKIFYFYFHKIDRNSRLWLVGADIDNEIYSFELRRLVGDLRLQEAVTFVGSVADSELRAFYENSDVYLAMSEHEGFCVPIIEAMHFGLPVVAYGSSAIPATVGDGGIVIDRKAPAEIAELLHILTTDNALRQNLIAAGRNRALRFGVENFTGLVKSQIIEPFKYWRDNRSGAESSQCRG